MKKVTKFINIIINRITNYKNYSIMTKTISFNELRRIKDSLPDGS